MGDTAEALTDGNRGRGCLWSPVEDGVVLRRLKFMSSAYLEEVGSTWMVGGALALGILRRIAPCKFLSWVLQVSRALESPASTLSRSEEHRLQDVAVKMPVSASKHVRWATQVPWGSRDWRQNWQLDLSEGLSMLHTQERVRSSTVGECIYSLKYI